MVGIQLYDLFLTMGVQLISPVNFAMPLKTDVPVIHAAI